MSEPKLCKGCRWAKNLAAGLSQQFPYDWECRHPSSLMPARPNLVTGEPREPIYASCEAARLATRTFVPESCGPTGRYWEPIGFGP